MEATQKRRLVVLVKLALTATVLYLLAKKIFGAEDAESMKARLHALRWGWLVPALAAQLFAVGIGTLRWQRLLAGQGIHATFRHLFGSMLIGRYFGAVTPAGIGFQGYRLYDVASRTGKPARSAATIGVEMIAGQLGFFSVLLVGSAFGSKYVQPSKLLLIDAGLLALVAAGVLFLARPTIVARLARAVLGSVPTKLQTLIDAVCAYKGQGARLVFVVVLSTLIHAAHNLLYFCAARALGVTDLTIGEIFFATSMQILSTFAPITINGVGVREATAVAFYTSVGVPALVAALIATLGFLVEMAVSLLGGPLFLVRRQSYSPTIGVDDPDREDRVLAEVSIADVAHPEPRRGFALGLAGGLLAGAIVGLAEGAIVLGSANGTPDYGVLWYGVLAYGLLCAGLGAVGGLVVAWLGRAIARERSEEAHAFARWAGLLVAAFGFVLGVFRIRRDVFDEQLVWKSKQGLLVLGGSLAAAALAYLLLAFVLRAIARRARFVAHPLFALLLTAAVAGGLVGLAAARPAVVARAARTMPAVTATRPGNVLFIVVDTLRADHLPPYGYADGHTPNLDRFAQEAIRFDQHFANASWTRPSFASILSGRYVASHRVMAKDDALPGELTTIAEAFGAGGYQTSGFVTNYNLTSYFQFDQGFDDYTYLEPEFVLGANDAQAKLLLVQMARRVIERFTPARPGSAYRDAATVNRAVFRWLDHVPHPTTEHPFFLFVAYMDPHDPYYVHPYDGTPGYARATHQSPGPEEAEHLRALYDGEIAYWDEQFGRLVADLQRRGLYDETTIVITADHGEEFMEHGGFWHGTTLYDEQVRVPLFVKLPFGTRGGEVVEGWTQSVDLMPSLLERAGLPAVPGTQGSPDVLRDGYGGASDVLAEESHEGNVLHSLRARRGRSETKIITANEGNPRGLGTTEVYRVDLDPGERVDVSGDAPAITELMRGRLVEDERRAARGRVENRTHVALGDHREALGALGYAGGSEPEPAAPDAGTPPP